VSPKPRHLAGLLDHAVARRGRRTAVIFRGRRWSYRELAAEVERLACGLRGMGVQRGDRVGVYQRNSAGYLVCYYAIARLGAVVVPINHFLTPPEIAHIIEDCELRILIASSVFHKEIQALRTRVSGLDVVAVGEEGRDGVQAAIAQGAAYRLYEELAACELDVPPCPAQPEDLAVIIYTSGTTGRPKGAMLSHANLLANASSVSRAIEIRPRDRFLLLLPMFHSFTEMVCMVTPITNGSSVVLMEKINAAELRRHVMRYRPSVLAAIPDVYASLAAAKPSKLARWLNPFRVYISGGAPLPQEIYRRFVSTWGRPLLEGYGLSEASPVVAVNPLHGTCKVGTVGVPIPDVEIRIVDDRMNRLPTGSPGEIAVRGGNVMMGYFNNPSATEQSIRDGWLLTGDIGSLDADGYLTILDRKKEMLIYRGCNVYPREVEEVLYSHPAVAEAAVVGVPDPVKGDVPIAFLVLRAEHSATARELKRYCAERLARYKVPRQFVFKDELPKTPTGKILKRELRQLPVALEPEADSEEPVV